MSKLPTLRWLVVGYGSIGSRHATLLTEIGQKVACCSQRKDVPFTVYANLEEALNHFGPDCVMVSNPTADHWHTCTVLEAAGFAGRALIEKPLFATLPTPCPRPSFEVRVAYNLRWHPTIRLARDLLKDRRIFSAQLSVGQYLPTWRPGTDYRASYSADSERGGGVLRDLSHEFDLIIWLLGDWKSVTGRVGRWGKLDIHSEDTADALIVTECCPAVSIHLDYQNLFPQRTLAVQAEGLSLLVDLIAGTVRTQDATRHFTVQRNDAYRLQLAMFMEDHEDLCTWEDGIQVVRLVEAIERASTRRSWEEA